MARKRIKLKEDTVFVVAHKVPEKDKKTMKMIAGTQVNYHKQPSPNGIIHKAWFILDGVRYDAILNPDLVP